MCLLELSNISLLWSARPAFSLTDPTVNRFAAPLAVTLFAAAHGSVDFYVTLLQALAPGMTQHLDLPLGRVVALVGIGQLIANGVQPLTGWIMGKRNLSWIMWAGAIIATLPALMGWASGHWTLALLVVVGAFGTGAFHPEGILAAHETSGDKAHFGVPLFMAGGYFFSAAAAPIAIFWVGRFGYRALAWLAIPGLLLALTLYRKDSQKRHSHPSVAIRPRSQRVTRREAGTLSFWPLLFVALFCNTATGLFMAILTSHYDLTFGPDSRVWAGWVLLIIGGLGSLASFFWGSVCRKKERYYLVAFATQLLAGPLFFLLAHASSPALGLAIAFPLSVVSPGAVYPVSVSLVRNASGATQALRAGLIVGGTWGIAALMIMLAGVLIDHGVSTTALVSVSAFSCLLAALLSGWQALAIRKAAQRPVNNANLNCLDALADTTRHRFALLTGRWDYIQRLRRRYQMESSAVASIRASAKR